MSFRQFVDSGNRRLAFTGGVWSGIFDLDSGGTLVSLIHLPTGCELLRRAASVAEHMATPVVFGIPPLFPPNRIDGGKFTIAGRDYQLPVNEAVTRSHLHGVAVRRPWRVVDVIDRGGEFELTLGFSYGGDAPEFAGFPVEFELLNRWKFGAAVGQSMLIRNIGTFPIPLALGYHTAFAAPADEGVRVTVPHASGFWRVDPVRRLPDGELLPWPDDVLAVLDGRVAPDSTAVAHMFPLKNAARCVTVRRRKLTFEYRFDRAFKHFACWNNGGKSGFFCTEPMSWMTDAPNVKLPPEVSGFAFVDAGRECQLATAIVPLVG